MSALSIQVPFPVFQDRDGQPLENGYVWIGEPNLNPQTNPVVAYYDQALTIVAAQPLRTLNGYISRAGTPAQVYIDGVDFSILVQDSKGSMVYSFPEGTGISANAAGVVYDPAGTGAVATTVQAKLRESVSAKDFGAVGDGVTDDTTAIQAALNASADKVLTFDGASTYLYSVLTFPANVRVVTNGATFSRIAASTSHGIIINDDTEIDQLIIATPGGSGGDKAIKIQGSNVHIEYVNVTAAAEGIPASTNWAIEVESSPSGTNLSRISINQFYCKYFSTAFFAKRASVVSVNNVIVDYYRTAFYLRDVARSTFDNVTCRYLGNGSNGIPGENGLLVESIVASNSSTQLRFSNWYVADAGEHSYRLGSQFAISDVWFDNCTSIRSGSAILGGDTSGGVWNGGCGFKVLGGTTTLTEFHENIQFTNCGVIDCNTTYGTFPTGHGINNFSPWLIVMAKNVILTSCWTKSQDQPIVARNGILFTAVDGLLISNCNFRDVNIIAIKPYQETPVVGFPGADLPILNLVITGGLFEVVTATLGNGIVLYMEEATAYANQNWTIKGAVFKGGTTAVRMTAPGAGSYTNLNYEYTYVGTTANDATIAAPSFLNPGSINIVCNVVAPWRLIAYDAECGNGSTWSSPNDGEVRTRTNSVWRKGSKTYSLFLLNDTVTTVAPPAAADGFIGVAAGGIATNLFGWYRATASPSSLKYSGGANAVMVNTVLTGTTGTVGNITIGIQNNLIYVENRQGSSATVRLSFV